MHKNAMAMMIELSALDDPIAAAVREATESRFVVAKLLRPELEASGYTLNEEELKVLTRVHVVKDGVIIAMGMSDTANDALLQAVLGYLKEQ